MKKVISLFMCILLTAGILAGCGGSSSSGGSDDELKVAVLLPSSPTDGGWGQTGADAIKGVEDKFDCTVAIVEAPEADKMKSEAEALADEGYDIIFGHGAQYANPFSEINKDYPDTLFVTMGGNIVDDNLFPVQVALEQSTYIAGVISGELSKTGKIGLVVGGDYPAYTKTSRGFQLGAESVRPDMNTMSAVLTNTDMNEAYETTMSQINAGADICWANANQATLGSLKAAKEKGVYYFGSQYDMASEAPDQVIASCTQSYVNTYTSIVQKYLDGTIVPEIQVVGFAEEAIDFVWNENVKKTLPENIQKIPDELIPKIISGEIVIPGEND